MEVMTTTPQSPKEALPGSDFPDRLWLKKANIIGATVLPDGALVKVSVRPKDHYLEYVAESALAEAVRKERELRQEIYNNASDALESLFQLDPNNQKRWNFFYTRATAGLRKACKLHEDEAAKGPAPKEEQK